MNLRNAKALKEISRVTKKGSFITVDAYRNKEEQKRMYDWNLTAKTIMSVEDWKKLFLNAIILVIFIGLYHE